MRPSLIALSLAAALATAACAAAPTARGDTNVLGARFDCLRNGALLVSAHRAVWDDTTPENSLAAIRRTGREIPGAMLEIDVAMTADGALVLMHDDDLERTTTGTGEVARLTLAEVRRARLVDGAGRTTEEPVPTFVEALAAVREIGGVASIDFKIEGDRERLFRAVVEAVRAEDMAEAAVLIAPNLEDARALHRLAPELSLSVPIDEVGDLAGLDPTRVLAWTGTREPRPGLWRALAAQGVEPMFGTLGREGVRRDDRFAADGDTSEYAGLAREGLAIVATDTPAAVRAGAPEAVADAGRCLRD
ncbi:MAG: glycerophosphodiester phosphodiesterase family protein [Brevundimonas sp.]